MGFMKPEVYQGSYYELDTTEGITIIPSDVVGHVTCLNDLEPFYLGRVMDEDKVDLEVKQGWLYRMSAPGYLDSTDWGADKTEKGAYDALESMYGDDDSSTDEDDD